MKQLPVPTLLSVLRPLGLRPDDASDAALTACEAAWLSGYFAALARDSLARGGSAEARASVASTAGAGERTSSARVTVLYGSETGNAEGVAKRLAERLRALGRWQLEVRDLAEYKARSLESEQTVVIVTSTHGDGTPPERATLFFEGLTGPSAPKSLRNLRYAVLGLGDSTYEHFCRAAKVVDERLSELGAERLVSRSDCDVEYEERAARWIDELLQKLGNEGAQAVVSERAGASVSVPLAVAPALVKHDKRHPFEAVVLENIRLTGRGSSKEIRHLSMSTEHSGLTFTPGDALGVCAQNAPSLVDALIEALHLSGSDRVSVGDDRIALEQALLDRFDITVPSPRFLEGWARLSGSSELSRLCDEELSSERRAFLASHHVLDLVRTYPSRSHDAEAFVALLRPLAARLYSIASSQALLPSEVQLVVSVVRYDQRGRACLGVASGHMAERASEGQSLRLYVQPNEGFRLPADESAPILMIGAGTGIAPYRAFMQERAAREQRGPSWLFFGERNFRTDFLYQTEWQAWLKSGLLTRLTPAFSRDQAEKIYVQQRLREQAREVYDWLERGAHVYVCGDAEAMAPAVHESLLAVVEGQVGSRERAIEYLQTLREQRRYQRDVY